MGTNCLSDLIGCILNPIAENPGNPALLAAISATTFVGGIAGARMKEEDDMKEKDKKDKDKKDKHDHDKYDHNKYDHDKYDHNKYDHDEYDDDEDEYYYDEDYYEDYKDKDKD